jgi:membrane-bound serine protease (ClpP class)
VTRRSQVTRVTRSTRPGLRRAARWTLWITLACVPLLVPPAPSRGQIPLPGRDTSEPEREGAEPEAPRERPRSIPADEPAEVTRARLVALPLAGRARLMAVQSAIAERIAGGAEGVYFGSIHDEIELGIAYYTERVIREAEQANAVVLIWDIETPGGRVDAAVMMRDYILESSVLSVAFVDRRAWSAGALISLGNDLIIAAEGSSIGAATPVTIGGGQMQPVEEKVVSALRGEFRAAAEATGRSAAVAEAMVDADLAVGGIIESGRLLTLTGREAVAAGIAEARVANRAALLELLGVTGQPVVEVGQSWAESLVRILTSSAVSGLLMTLGLLGIFFELTTPGFGWAGAMGIGALVLFFTGHLLVNLAGSEEILLFVLGLALLGVEIFLIPGFGILGIVGILAVGAALTLALVNLDVSLELSPLGLHGALMRVALSLAATLVLSILLLKLAPRTALGRSLVLSEVLAAGPSIAESSVLSIRAGDNGVALTDLRPFGKARIGERRTEVVAESGFVPKGSPLRVTRVSENRIEVRAVRGPLGSDTA